MTNRRDFIALTAAGLSFPFGVAGLCAATPSDAELSAAMSKAAAEFIGLLDPKDKLLAQFEFESTERTRWHWTVTSTFPRKGLPLSEMREEQRRASFGLLEASLSRLGFEKARRLMALQAELPTGAADPLGYFVSVFGVPGSARWGWRFEGHHLSHQFSVIEGTVSVTPFFHGAWPTLARDGSRAMAREEDAARDIVRSLAGSLRQRVIFQSRAPSGHVTQNQVRVEPLPPVGLLLGELGNEQRSLALEIISTYLAALPPNIAARQQHRINASGIDTISFGWAGAIEPQRPHYYRLQGKTFLLEFDNSLNGGTHIHSVWRDFEADFGSAPKPA